MKGNPMSDMNPMWHYESGLRHAYEEAERSLDPSSQIGAVVVRDAFVIGAGCNRFPKWIHNTDERWNDRPTKYALVVHAEVAATISALRHVNRLQDCTLFVNLPACTGCAKVIIESGIRHVVGHLPLLREADRQGMWQEERDLGLGMLDEAGVTVDWYPFPIEDAPTTRIGGVPFDPKIAR